MTKERLAVLAVGGNALCPPDGIHDMAVEEQKAAAFAKVVAAFRQNGYRTLIVHGNGPQVGNLLLQNELASGIVPTLTLDMCNAQTQGSIGYLLQKALLKEFHRQGITDTVTGIITTVEVKKPDNLKPEKPVGRFYSLEELRQIDPDGEKYFVQCEPGKWRRMVLSPEPVRVFEAANIRLLIEQGAVVIAGGGGGLAYVSHETGYSPLEAIVDKDLTAALLAKQLSADLLFLMTNVDEVLLHYGTPQQKALRRVTSEEMRTYLEEGYFPAGSMGPKVRAAIDFVETTGNSALITRPELAEQAIAGERGTLIGSEACGANAAQLAASGGMDSCGLNLYNKQEMPG